MVGLLNKVSEEGCEFSPGRLGWDWGRGGEVGWERNGGILLLGRVLKITGTFLNMFKLRIYLLLVVHSKDLSGCLYTHVHNYIIHNSQKVEITCVHQGMNRKAERGPTIQLNFFFFFFFVFRPAPTAYESSQVRD